MRDIFLDVDTHRPGEFPMMRKLPGPTLCEGVHRSGWPYVMEALDPLFDDSCEVLFDDFVERTFLYVSTGHNPDEVNYDMPWVGALHQPPNTPLWYFPNQRLEAFAESEPWNRCLPNLRLLIVLGHNLKDWVDKHWGIPCAAIQHPTGRPMEYWSPEAFLRGPKRLLQVGWYGRNTMAIYQLKEHGTFTKAHLVAENGAALRGHNFCKKNAHCMEPPRFETYGQVEMIGRQDDAGFDRLMASSVVFLELLSSVANNTLVECIARNTPICLNRTPGPDWYLGTDYPLWWDHWSEIPNLLTVENVMAAHHYLKRLDKGWIRGDVFRESVRQACIEHVPELAGHKIPAEEIECLI